MSEQPEQEQEAQPPLPALIDAWEAFSDSLRGGYDYGLDEYLNDVDLRYLIAKALANATAPVDEELRAQLDAADDRVRTETEPSKICLWGSRNAEEHGWDATTHWWYWAMPKRRDEQFDEDLEHVR